MAKLPTPSQQTALKLALIEPIRYYKGGWYCIPSQASEHQERPPCPGAVSVLPQTLKACVAKGWLKFEQPFDIYSARWEITDEGREVF